MSEWKLCVNQIHNKYLPDLSYSEQNEEILKATNCFFNTIKLRGSVLSGIDKCIDIFEEKRTKKW